ncbi:aminopeptidase N [Specibacter sp. AOP5-B1-6]|uniref:aminopeptidase N n=1 Tax=Specibacter sp. AOP5-B1-6 TaxID=3457653 RepID=UPI00402B6F62
MSNHNLLRSEAAARKSLLTVHSYDVDLDLGRAEDLSVAGFPTRSTIVFSADLSRADSSSADSPSAASSSAASSSSDAAGSAAPVATFLDFIGLSVESVLLNGVELNLADVVDGARIHLPSLAAENEVVVAATAAYSSSGEGLHRFVDPADGRTYTYTQYEPSDARRVFANFEQPDLKAPFTFHVTAPADWEVASNQAVANQSQQSQQSQQAGAAGADRQTARWDFAATLPISTYITTVLAGPYFKVEDHFSMDFGPDSSHNGQRLDIPLAAYCRASLAPHFDAEEIFKVTKAGLKYFNELFDHPYPFGKYEQAFVPEYNLGAMENPGLVTFTEAYIHASRATDTAYQQRANTIMHEMAHMWFGDLVTMTWWDDLWLKESFADYMGHLAVAEATPWGAKSWTMFASRRKAWAYTQDQLPTTHPIVADIVDLEAAKANFDGITYAKGASVLKQLVAYVGQDAFIAGSRQYFKDHEYANTTLNDLLTPLSAASGRDLGDWAEKWLQTSGMSTLTPDLETANGKITSLSIRQDAVDPVTGREALRPHRLAVGFFTYDGGALVRTGSITLDVVGQVTEVPGAAGLPAPNLVIINDDDQSYAKVRLDPSSMATALAGVGSIANPMARSLVWSSLWNATRDALLPAAAYLRAVVQHAGGEADISLLQTLADNALSALDFYCAPADRPSVREMLIAGVSAHLVQAAPASDEQLVWARALAELGRGSDSVVARSRAMLAGVDVPDGLSVDGSLRWLLWQQLAARGAATVAELDAELAADTTAEHRASHCTAVAALPDAGMKQQRWNEAVEEKTLTNQLLSATIAGFNVAGSELLDPYIEPYFEAIERVWNGRSLEIAGRIVRGLFPARQALAPNMVPEQHPVVLRTDAWLARNPDAARGLRRIVLEQRDQLMRSLKAQAVRA